LRLRSTGRWDWSPRRPVDRLRLLETKVMSKKKRAARKTEPKSPITAHDVEREPIGEQVGIFQSYSFKTDTPERQAAFDERCRVMGDPKLKVEHYGEVLQRIIDQEARPDVGFAEQPIAWKRAWWAAELLRQMHEKFDEASYLEAVSLALSVGIEIGELQLRDRDRLVAGPKMGRDSARAAKQTRTAKQLAEFSEVYARLSRLNPDAKDKQLCKLIGPEMRTLVDSEGKQLTLTFARFRRLKEKMRT
jgi:hypothetical protein